MNIKEFKQFFQSFLGRQLLLHHLHVSIIEILFQIHAMINSDEYSKFGSRGKDSQKLVFSIKKKEGALIWYFTIFPKSW